MEPVLSILLQVQLYSTTTWRVFVHRWVHEASQSIVNSTLCLQLQLATGHKVGYNQYQLANIHLDARKGLMPLQTVRKYANRSAPSYTLVSWCSGCWVQQLPKQQ